MKKLLYILLSSFFLLSACATEENYKNQTGPWDPNAGSINMRLNPRAKARPWPKKDGKFIIPY